MKAARLEKSRRLQDVLLILSDGQWKIIPDPENKLDCKIMARMGTPVKTLISELRANGIAVKSRRIPGTRIWEYRIGNAQ